MDIFRSSRRVSWLLESLAGRDVRQSLEMFARILMSGHLDERAITGTLLGAASYYISDTTIIRTLMKTDYLYFDDGHGFVTNIFYCDPRWSRGSNFLVIEALHFLVTKRKQKSDLGPQGYLRTAEVIDHLQRMGFVNADSQSALEYLLLHGLIQADHLRRRGLSRDDYIRAHASAFVHLRILADRIEYLAAILPVTYLADRNLADKVGSLSLISPGFTDPPLRRKQEATRLFLEYLRREYDRHCDESPIFGNQAAGSRFAVRAVQSSLESGRRSIAPTSVDQSLGLE